MTTATKSKKPVKAKSTAKVKKPVKAKSTAKVKKISKKPVKEKTDSTLNKVVIHSIENFISNEENEQVLADANKDFRKMKVLGKDAPTDYRIAQGTWLFENVSSIAKTLKQRIADLLQVSPKNFEELHIVKYDVGGEYKTHHDFFHANTDYYEEAMKKGGQRMYSALFYLNDDFEGGETDFPNINYKAIPKKNKLIVWRNVNENNEVEYDSLHAGLPVTKGTKYIGIFWVREGSFQ